MLATACLVVAALYFAQEVFVPLALAVLFTFLLTPIVVRLERKHVPRAVASTGVVLIALCLIGVLMWTLSSQAVDIANQLPAYRKNVSDKISHLPFLHGQGVFSKLTSAADDLKNQISPVDSSKQQPMPVVLTDQSPVGFSQISSLLGVVAGPLAMTFIVTVFVIFMLLRREDLRDRLIRLVGGGRLDITTRALSEAGDRISRYLLMQSLVNASYGIVIGIGLWTIGHLSGQKGGFPDAPLWGLLCGLFRFVPYVGAPIGAFFPVVLSIAVFPGIRESIATVGLFAVVEILNNSFVEPMLYGSTTGLSAVAVLASAVFWSWLWGPIGLLLSTPITACLLVIGKYVPQMEFLNVLLGDDPPLPPATQLYQRLLALDLEAAAEVIHGLVREMSLEAVYDKVVIPALAMGEHDHHMNRLEESRHAVMRQCVRDVIDELGDREKALAVNHAAAAVEHAAKSDTPPPAASAPVRYRLPGDCNVTALCLPAHDDSDELVARIMAQLLELRGYCVSVIGHSALASEMLDAIEEKDVHLVLVSALPPTAITHARYLCKRVLSRFPEMSIVVGLWMFDGDRARANERIAEGETVHLTSSITEALEESQQIAQAALLRKNAPLSTAAN
jgi:predicted PurR-regulated permease PerM